MHCSTGMVTVVALAGALFIGPAAAQQIQQAPLPPVAPPQAVTTGQGVPLPQPQVAQSPPAHLTTQDCVQMRSAVEQTDCLNELAAQGDYMPTPAPAPGTQMPMEFRLPLGKRQVAPPQ